MSRDVQLEYVHHILAHDEVFMERKEQVSSMSYYVPPSLVSLMYIDPARQNKQANL